MFNFQHQAWFVQPALQRVWRALNTPHSEARAVGGCVRNAMLGLPVADVDLAINVPPEKTEEILAHAGVVTKRTGFAHGTIMAIEGGQGFEITSLRQDVATDGRRAVVAYTDDWKTDAARRDFTFNAMSVDVEGRLYDYFGGVNDLAARLVRFIGDPAQRLAEDYLRLLRYFRFLAWYGVMGDAAADPNRQTAEACREAAPHLATLSVERVWSEVKKILSAENPVPALALMEAWQVMPHVFKTPVSLPRLHDVVALEHKMGAAPHALVRLVALALPDQESAENLSQHWHVSNDEAALLIKASQRPVVDWFSLPAVRVGLYRHGAAAMRAWYVLMAAQQGFHKTEAWNLIQHWKVPALPISGRDVQGLGIQAGPEMGKILQEVAEWWQQNDFMPGKTDCLDYVRRRITK
ncbi:MAG: CCA tRNA nucleotidyltransferase [Alphaproteobacteria bacterium]|nr:CCA tRNA nucleotidyltransferase [Alphaproteobacteria bacterium]NDC55913.1 CCA tRNA nucleotidyltransferase [Alphaproteobacteria bacterium]NDG04475.1 CCA tRNA nucleotidyltransferase [Alphaproteobacteria bacterium]